MSNTPRYLTDEGDLKVSASSLETYEQCPRKWKHIYVDNARSVSNFSTLTGSFAHAVLEELYQWEPEERTVELAKEIARYEWDKMMHGWGRQSGRMGRDLASLKLPEDEQRRMRQAAWRSIKGVWEMEVPSEIEVIDVEREFMIEHDGAYIRGYIDRVEKTDFGLRIADYKTGNVPPQRYKKKKLFQVFIYAKAAEELYEEPVASAALLFLGKEIIEGEVTDAVRRATQKRLSSTIGAIQQSLATGEFEPRTGPLCAWCDFLPYCPEGIEQVYELDRFGRVRLDSPGAQFLGLG